MSESQFWNTYVSLVIAFSVMTVAAYIGCAVAVRLAKPLPRVRRLLFVVPPLMFALLLGVTTVGAILAFQDRPAHPVVNIELTPVEYKERLRRRRDRIREESADAGGAALKRARSEYDAVSAKLENIENSYRDYVSDVRGWVRQLGRFAGEAPDEVTENVRLAMIAGSADDALVDRYLETLENVPGLSAAPAARAAALRGALAEHWARYGDAFRHYARAAGRVPNDVEYNHWAAYLAAKSGRSAEAAAYFVPVYRARQRRYGRSHDKTLEIAESLTWHYLESEQYGKSISVGENAMRLTLENAPLDHSRISNLSRWLVYAFSRMEEDRRAVDYAKMAVKAETHLHGPRSIQAAGAGHTLAVSLERSGEYREALKHYRRSLNIYSEQPDRRDDAAMRDIEAGIERSRRKLIDARTGD